MHHILLIYIIKKSPYFLAKADISTLLRRGHFNFALTLSGILERVKSTDLKIVDVFSMPYFYY